MNTPNTKPVTRNAFLLASLLLGGMASSGCALDAQDTSESTAADATNETANEAAIVSEVALKTEQAVRMIERGGSMSKAKALLQQALAAPDASPHERMDALVALSRAHEAAGEREQAITVLEVALAKRDPAMRDTQPLRERLAALLMPNANDHLSAAPERPVAPFANVLAEYSRPNAKGGYSFQFYMAGGSSATNEAGTFNVKEALEARQERDCPLCENELKISGHTRQSNWLVIPEAQSQFAGAYLVFYFDLGRNRIPARYDEHLPIPSAEIVAELERGKSFVMAKERAGSPPSILIAAPRTAMLDDTERHLAALTELPTEPSYAPVSRRLRTSEISQVVRSQMRSPLRACYEALRQSDPAAEGKIVMEFVVDAEGTPQQLKVSSQDAPLTEPTFVSCSEKAAQSMHFPATDGSVSVTYPFVLRTE